MKKIIAIGCALLLGLPGFCQERFYTFSGDMLTVNDILSSEKAVLMFWTTRCPYCRKDLKRLDKEYNYSSSINFFYINIGERKSDIESLARYLKLSDETKKRIVLDQKSYLAEKYSVIGIPFFIFLKNGEVIFRSYSMNNKILWSVFDED